MTHYLSEKRLQEIIFLGFTKYLLQTFPNFSTLIKLVSVGVKNILLSIYILVFWDKSRY
ncbi:MAG: hypothetical protein O4861_24420 [Trichodesmium sp. St16_bin4-tuft]|nr:hypothetical protein [Trichodesmium sp. MAG_R01]MDE5101300.1 hypothetical protein [Trichodesmium sp. St16_bin4-tuft]